MPRGNPIATCRTGWRRPTITALAAPFCLWLASVAAAHAAGAEAEAGRQIFEEQCAACHTLGGGDLVGPDLAGVTARRSRDWLQHWIAAPDEMLANRDPVATELLHRFNDVEMPNLELAPGDVAAVLAYLDTAAPAEAPAPEATAVSGDPVIGKELFTGAARFGNGGPPCMACHSAAGIGALGGGQLGPDLTTVATRLGGPMALAAFVGGSPTPTMRAIWAEHPLSAIERADVVAFLAQAPLSRRAPQAIWQLVALALLGLAILMAGTGLVWRRRLREVRRPMIAAGRQTRGKTKPVNRARTG